MPPWWQSPDGCGLTHTPQFLAPCEPCLFTSPPSTSTALFIFLHTLLSSAVHPCPLQIELSIAILPDTRERKLLSPWFYSSDLMKWSRVTWDPRNFPMIQVHSTARERNALPVYFRIDLSKINSNEVSAKISKPTWPSSTSYLHTPCVLFNNPIGVDP